MNKHILLSTDDPGVGGVSQYNHSLICGLIELGYQVTCLQPQAFNEWLITYQKQLGVQHLWLGNNAVRELPHTLATLSKQPDLVIFSNSNPFSNFAIKQITIQLGIPYIVVEGLVEPCLADHFADYLNELSQHYTQAKSVIAVSHDNLSLLHQLFKLPKHQGQVIYYGRPSEYFTPHNSSVREQLRQELGIPSDAVVCFTAARIETRKGYQYQLEAIEHLMGSAVWPQLYFVWVGAGIFEPQLEAQLREAVEQLKITNKVKFLGQRSDISIWLNTADIFVFPSQLEGMPLCVMEAMAKGLPVIATAVSGIPEELGSTGKLLPDPKINPQATIRELVTVVQDWGVNPELRHRIGQACKQRAEEMFREERMVEETVQVIKPALSKTEKLSSVIIVDGVFFQLYNTGIARVWKSLLEEWADNGFAKHVVVLERAGTAPKISGIRYRTVPPYDYNSTFTDRKMLQRVCDEEGANLFISTYYTTPLTTPSVFMAYDMLPEVMGADLETPMWREKHQGIRHASAYVAISENTARDLVKVFPDIFPKVITVAHCGVNSTFSPSGPNQVGNFKTKYGISKPYFVLVGAGSGHTDTYKNTILFFKAFSRLCSRQAFDIVCTGGGLLEDELRDYTSGSAVHMLRLNDEELRAAYSGAIALVYPSKYEGFGLPVLEAIACGCPVITCPNASIPEVAGEAALYVNDDDVNGLANALCDVQKPDIRNSLIAAGLERAKKFSWSEMAETVSSALIAATLLPLNLKQANFIIFPDWDQPEDLLLQDLTSVVRAVVTHPDKSQMTLLIDTGDLPQEDANLALSTVVMNLLMEEDLDVTDGPEISLIRKLSPLQWEALLPHLQARIVLEHGNQRVIATVGVENIPLDKLDSLTSRQAVTVQGSSCDE